MAFLGEFSETEAAILPGSQRVSIPIEMLREPNIHLIRGSNDDDEFVVAKMLDASGAVIVLGDAVIIHPDQVVKEVQNVISKPNDPIRSELEKMAIAKLEINEQAKGLVKREIWFGLVFLVVQTVGLIWLTFWGPSQKLMERTSFFYGCIFSLLSYAFYLMTRRDLSFEAFFQARFNANQKRLIKIKQFDVDRFNELRLACGPSPSQTSLPGV